MLTCFRRFTFTLPGKVLYTNHGYQMIKPIRYYVSHVEQLMIKQKTTEMENGSNYPNSRKNLQNN